MHIVSNITEKLNKLIALKGYFQKSATIYTYMLGLWFLSVTIELFCQTGHFGHLSPLSCVLPQTVGTLVVTFISKYERLANSNPAAT